MSFRKTFPIVLVAAIACGAADLPAPATDIPTPGNKRPATAVLAGGCFWGIEAVFEHLNGVLAVVSGYAGGEAATAQYETVGTGATGHAESVQITYDPSRISYGKLLQVFFAVAHDPTQLNRQGPDEGTQYRSAIFFSSDAQKKVAEAYIQQLDRAKVLRYPIVTQVTTLRGFYPAEAYHQHYLDQHPDNPYIVYNDLPKLKELERQFPDLLKHR
jgi:peptide-methionine (S)-S-oxide reductase